MLPASDKTHELEHHDERARSRLCQTQPCHHLLMGKPAKIFHGLLGYIRQDRIGSAEGDQRRLAEKNPLGKGGAFPAQPCADSKNGHPPKCQTTDRNPQQTRPGVLRALGQNKIARFCRISFASVSLPGRKLCRNILVAPPTNQSSCQHDDHKRYIEKVDSDKGQHRHRLQRSTLERFPADPEHGFGDQCHHCRQQSVEQRR